MIIVKYVEDRHLTNMMSTEPTQNQTGGLKQTRTGDTSKSPDLRSDAF